MISPYTAAVILAVLALLLIVAAEWSRHTIDRDMDAWRAERDARKRRSVERGWADDDRGPHNPLGLRG